MKKLAAKLTALLLVCLLLPLTACSPVDFSEQINDVYAYEDFEVTVRMPRYYQASAMDPNAPLDIEVELRYTGDKESIEIGHSGIFSAALLYYEDEEEPMPPHSFTQELHLQTVYKDQPLWKSGMPQKRFRSWGRSSPENTAQRCTGISAIPMPRTTVKKG